MPDINASGLAASATRRTTLAAALLVGAALTQSPTAEARKSCRKRARQSVEKTCSRMRDECLAFYTSRCNDSSNPQACLADMTVCCDYLADGNFTEHGTCLYAPR